MVISWCFIAKFDVGTTIFTILWTSIILAHLTQMGLNISMDSLSLASLALKNQQRKREGVVYIIEKLPNFVLEFSIISLNFVNCLFHPWISHTSIKMVPLSKGSVTDDDVSSCMLCCHVHVSTRKSRVQWPIWWKWSKPCSFDFSVVIFLCFQ